MGVLNGEKKSLNVEKKNRKNSIVTRLVMGIATLTLILLAGLGSIIYFRILKLNQIQFEDKMENTIRMTDDLMKAHFESIRTSLNTIAELELVRRSDESITSYVNLTDPSGKVAMKPMEASPYEAEVYLMAKDFVQQHAEILGVSVSLQSNGSFVRYPSQCKGSSLEDF